MLNTIYGGQRRCILVTNNEVDAKLAARLEKDSVEPGSAEYEKHGICSAVTWPRVRAVLTGQRKDKSKLPGRYVGPFAYRFEGGPEGGWMRFCPET